MASTHFSPGDVHLCAEEVTQYHLRFLNFSAHQHFITDHPPHCLHFGGHLVGFLKNESYLYGAPQHKCSGMYCEVPEYWSPSLVWGAGGLGCVDNSPYKSLIPCVRVSVILLSLLPPATPAGVVKIFQCFRICTANERQFTSDTWWSKILFPPLQSDFPFPFLYRLYIIPFPMLVFFVCLFYFVFFFPLPRFAVW